MVLCFGTLEVLMCCLFCIALHVTCDVIFELTHCLKFQRCTKQLTKQVNVQQHDATYFFPIVHFMWLLGKVLSFVFVLQPTLHTFATHEM